MREECTKYGVVASVEVPRPVEGMLIPGVGKVCLLSDGVVMVTTVV